MMNKKVISLIREMKDDYNYNESIKTLRTNIQFCGSNYHTIMFTSCHAWMKARAMSRSLQPVLWHRSAST